ncbi:MAG: hypothetical protein ACRDTG_08085 [Pseudonocardiaceae bacterium]
MSTSAPTTTWVCAEGPNGVGKTHLLHALADRLGPRCQLLTELTDAEGDHVPAQVISALSTGDSFLRTGHPRTETFALIALKVREYELVTQLATPPRIVLEDRGIDTTALYQAAILLGPDASDDDTWALAQQIHATAAFWRPAPELVLLILDDLGTCLRRYAERVGRPMTGEEQYLVTRVALLYQRQADHEPERFRIVHRAGRDEQDVLEEMEHLVLAGIGER